MPIVYSFRLALLPARENEEDMKDQRRLKKKKTMKQTSPVSNEERLIAPVDEEGLGPT